MDVMKKVPVREQAPDVRNKNFDEVCLGYNAEEAQEEATRCLNCKNARCVQGCPVSINIPEFIHNVKEGNFEEAFCKGGHCLSIGNETDIDTADTAYRAILLHLRTVTGQGDMKRSQPVDFHFIALSKRQPQLLHKCFNGMLHIPCRKRRLAFNGGSHCIDIHDSYIAGFLANVIQHRSILLIHILPTLIAFY